MNQGLLSAQVNAGCMLFMHRDCLAQLQEDTADCLLYTQLAATKRHDRFEHPAKWVETWLAASGRFGYVLKNTESLSLPVRESGEQTLWEWGRGHLPACCPRELFIEGERLAKRSWLGDPNQLAFTLLARQTLEALVPMNQPSREQGHKVVLQLGMLDAAGELSLMTMIFTARTSLRPDFLFQVFSAANVIGNVEIRYHCMRMLPVYASMRSAVRDALVDRRTNLCSPLT